ncbi:hypothetical protein [Kytococcus sedentarius]|uniref:hypothetical protein n=1 Tax=Kytococcus sedentarius TaxID=1276 RepID=UPI00194EFF5A|nr:hypothetical protein [Kytococcus sedentarius]QRO87249.1 hypothetical protein I6J30_10635 [Kytococcus sedentarius]
MTGVVKVPFVVLGLWALDRWLLEVGLGVQDHVIAAALGALVCETVMALVRRPFVLNHDHPDPGDALMTLLLLLVPWPLWVAVLWLAGEGAEWALSGATVATVVYTVFTLAIDRPWREGDDMGEVGRKWQETKDMTREL